LYLALRQPDHFRSVLVSQARLLVKEQHQPTTLRDLNRNGAPANGVECILHEIVRESTTNGHWTWHSGFLSLPGFFGIHLLIAKVYSNHDVICETDHLVTVP
jgi:hypothetical protein